MRETYHVEIRTEGGQRWSRVTLGDRRAALEWANRIAAEGKLDGSALAAVRVVTVTEQYEIVRPPKEATDA